MPRSYNPTAMYRYAAMQGAGGSGSLGAIVRLILKTNGTTAYGTVDTPLAVVSGDTITVVFSNTHIYTGGAGNHGVLVAGTSGTEGYIYADATANTVAWDAAKFSGVTLDGVATTTLVTSFPTDGETHTFIGTYNAATNLAKTHANTALNPLKTTRILSIELNRATGGITTWPIDSGSATTLLDSAGGNPITLTSVSAGDWDSFTLDTINNRWVSGNKFANPNFDADTDWTKGTGITIAAGVASFDGTQVADTDLKQDLSAYFDIRDQCLTEYTQLNWSAGNSGGLAGGTATVDNATNAVHSEVVVFGSTATDSGIRGDLDLVADVDNASMKLIIPVN